MNITFHEDMKVDPTTGRRKVRWEADNGVIAHGYANRPGKGYTITCPTAYQVHTEQVTRTGGSRRTPKLGAELLAKWMGIDEPVTVTYAD